MERNYLENLLRNYHNFQDCVLLKVNWLFHGFTLEFVINYIWDEFGDLRVDLDDYGKEGDDAVIVRFKNVQEFHIQNNMSKAHLSNPENIDWAVDEIGEISIENDIKYLDHYKDLPIEFHHAVIYSTNERRIDIVFSNLEIVRKMLKLF